MTNDIKHSGGYGWQWDFSATMSDDGTWSVSVVYIAKPGEKYTPKYSTKCPVDGFKDLLLKSFTQSKIADLWKTECTFQKDVDEEDDDDDDSGENPDDDPATFEPADTKTTWEFSAGVVSKAIFDHPKFSTYFSDNPDVKKAYEAIMSGRIDLSKLESGGKLKRRDPYDSGSGKLVFSSAVQDLFEKIITKGITDYYERSCSYSITSTEGKTTDSVLQSLINASGGQFLKTGESNTPQGRKTEVTLSYSQILEKGVIKL